MCGLFGEFVLKGSLTDKGAFRALNALSNERGPDSTDFYDDGRRIQLGFNRLAILDLSELGSQPMKSPTGRYVIVFNGEIYNHPEIRQKLEAKGHSFKGHSDTETIVNAIEAYGIRDTVKMLDGMFAIAIFDSVREHLTLVRDFAGIKPLFVGYHPNRILFGSQYNQITKHVDFNGNSVNQASLRVYLQQNFLPAPLCMYENTFQLRPGEMLEVDSSGDMKHHIYWEFPEFHQHDINDSTEALEYLDAELRSAVKSEMMTDVPLGAFLSGGIDSPLVVSNAQRMLKDARLRAFTIKGSSPKHDESERARRYAEAFGVDLRIEHLNDTLILDIFNQCLSHVYDPVADYSILPTYLVSKLARQEVTVALSGDGGDELFFGYDRFHSILKNIKLFEYPRPLRKLAYYKGKVLGNSGQINEHVFHQNMAQAHFAYHSKIDNKTLKSLFPDLGDIAYPNEFNHFDYSSSKSELEMLNKMRKAEYLIMMQKTLRKVDLMSMANSLEVRVPFLKKSFIEASFRVNPFLSYGKDKTKEVLKKMLCQYAPEDVVRGPKKGFFIPLSGAIRSSFTQFEELIIGLRTSVGASPGATQSLLQEFKAGKSKSAEGVIFNLLILGSWFRNQK